MRGQLPKIYCFYGWIFFFFYVDVIYLEIDSGGQGEVGGQKPGWGLAAPDDFVGEEEEEVGLQDPQIPRVVNPAPVNGVLEEPNDEIPLYITSIWEKQIRLVFLKLGNDVETRMYLIDDENGKKSGGICRKKGCSTSK